MITEFRAEGWVEFQQKLDEFTPDLKAEAVNGMREIARIMVPATRSNTPVKTGELARSTEDEVRLGDWPELVIKQLARAPEKYGGALYGIFVRQGTRPHVIRPRFAQALRFEIGGEIIWATIVHHPGNRPNPYHLRTYQRHKAEVQRVIETVGIRVIEAMTAKVGNNL